jgi:hypothetical protein
MFYLLTISSTKPPDKGILEHIRDIHKDLPLIEKTSEDILEYGFKIVKVDDLIAQSIKKDEQLKQVVEVKYNKELLAEKDMITRQEKIAKDSVADGEKPYEPTAEINTGKV